MCSSNYNGTRDNILSANYNGVEHKIEDGGILSLITCPLLSALLPLFFSFLTPRVCFESRML